MTWIFGVSAFIGNGFVIGWRICPHPGRKQRSANRAQSILVTNLAIADGLMGVYMLIIASADVYYRDQYAYFAEAWQTSLICKFAGFLSVLSSEASVFFMTVISIDRGIAIIAPFSRLNLKTKGVAIVVTVVWMMSVLVSVMPVLVKGYFGNAFYGRSTVCLALPLTADRPAGWQYSVTLFLGVNCLAFIIMLICYSAIYITIKQSRKSADVAQRSGEIALAIRMGFLVFTDFACWMPIIIMGLLALGTDVTISPEMYVWTAVFILPLNSSLNPYMYTILTREVANRQRRKRQLTSAYSLNQSKGDLSAVEMNHHREVKGKNNL